MVKKKPLINALNIVLISSMLTFSIPVSSSAEEPVQTESIKEQAASEANDEPEVEVEDISTGTENDDSKSFVDEKESSLSQDEEIESEFSTEAESTAPTETEPESEQTSKEETVTEGTTETEESFQTETGTEIEPEVTELLQNEEKSEITVKEMDDEIKAKVLDELAQNYDGAEIRNYFDIHYEGSFPATIEFGADVESGEDVFLLHWNGTEFEKIIPDNVTNHMITATFQSLSPVAVICNIPEPPVVNSPTAPDNSTLTDKNGNTFAVSYSSFDGNFTMAVTSKQSQLENAFKSKLAATGNDTDGISITYSICDEYKAEPQNAGSMEYPVNAKIRTSITSVTDNEKVYIFGNYSHSSSMIISKAVEADNISDGYITIPDLPYIENIQIVKFTYPVLQKEIIISNGDSIPDITADDLAKYNRGLTQPASRISSVQVLGKYGLQMKNYIDAQDKDAEFILDQNLDDLIHGCALNEEIIFVFYDNSNGSLSQSEAVLPWMPDGVMTESNNQSQILNPLFMKNTITGNKLTVSSLSVPKLKGIEIVKITYKNIDVEITVKDNTSDMLDNKAFGFMNDAYTITLIRTEKGAQYFSDETINLSLLREDTVTKEQIYTCSIPCPVKLFRKENPVNEISDCYTIRYKNGGNTLAPTEYDNNDDMVFGMQVTVDDKKYDLGYAFLFMKGIKEDSVIRSSQHNTVIESCQMQLYLIARAVIQPVPEPEPVPTPTPTPQPEPDPVPEPQPQPTPEPDPTPEPQPVPTPEPEPIPEPEPAPEPEPQPIIPVEPKIVPPTKHIEPQPNKEVVIHDFKLSQEEPEPIIMEPTSEPQPDKPFPIWIFSPLLLLLFYRKRITIHGALIDQNSDRFRVTEKNATKEQKENPETIENIIKRLQKESRFDFETYKEEILGCGYITVIPKKTEIYAWNIGDEENKIKIKTKEKYLLQFLQEASANKADVIISFYDRKTDFLIEIEYDFS